MKHPQHLEWNQVKDRRQLVTYEAQQLLDFILSNRVKAAGDTTVAEISDVSPDMEFSEIETMSASPNQTVTHLQQWLQAGNNQLTEEKDHYLALE